jgi:dipeptidyl aminopeptidase/acylaminoacyl peptidase
MSIDELATAATEDLLEVARSRTDTTQRRHDLARAVHVRRRARGTAAAVALLAAALLGASVVSTPRTAPPTTPSEPTPTLSVGPQPAHYTGNGPILIYTKDGFQLVDLRTGRPTPLSMQHTPATERMAWSPDGRYIVGLKVGENTVVEADTGRTLQVYPREDAPFLNAWFPSGRIVWSTDGPFADGGPEGLADGTAALPEGTTIGWVTWSPDGARAAFLAGSGYGKGEIYVANADGSALHQLPTRNGPADLGPFMPAWSPDGSRLLYAEVGPVGDEGAKWSIMTIEPDGSHRTRVADGGEFMGMGKWETYPIWSPDSQKIAFLGNYSATEHGWGLYITDLQGHVGRVPLSIPPALPALAWRPVP